MNYYKVIFTAIPQIVFAHNHATRQHNLYFPKQKGFIEISYISKGALTARYGDGETRIFPENSINFHLRTRDMTIKSDGPHSHSTVGIAVEFVLVKMNEEQVIACSKAAAMGQQNKELFAIMPDFIFEQQKGGKIHVLLQKIIRSRIVGESCRELYGTGLLLEMLAEITRETVRRAYLSHDNKVSPGSFLYCENAIRYLSDHIGEKVNVGAVAAELGISSGYLSTLFKTVTGQSIIEYSNRMKVGRIKELLINKKVSLRDAGDSVGITDENYLSRIFKKYTGGTISEYRHKSS